MTETPLIIITNDDGIKSPGLAALAQALDPLGELLIVAPEVQQSGMGRSIPSQHRGRLTETIVSSNGKTWKAYAADASPAQAVLHALLELADRKPTLVASGINFGENVGLGVTISGTVGAALEGAAHGIRSIAVSMQVDMALHHDFDINLDFSPAIPHTRLLAQKWLASDGLPDVEVLKIEVPNGATPDTPWQITRLERKRYYIPTPPVDKQPGQDGRIGYMMKEQIETSGPDTDVAVLLSGQVSVTPLSLDMTSRVKFGDVKKMLS